MLNNKNNHDTSGVLLEGESSSVDRKNNSHQKQQEELLSNSTNTTTTITEGQNNNSIANDIINEQKQQEQQPMMNNIKISVLSSLEASHPQQHLSIESSLEQHMDDYIADDDNNINSNNNCKSRKHHPVEFLTKKMKSFSNSDVLNFFKKPSPRSASPNEQPTTSLDLLSSLPHNTTIPSSSASQTEGLLGSQQITRKGKAMTISSFPTHLNTPPKVKKEKSTGNICSSSSDEEIASMSQLEKKRRSRQQTLPLNETKVKKIALKTIYNMMVLQPSITDRILPLLLIDVRSCEKDFISTRANNSTTNSPQHNHSFSVSEMSNILSSQIENELVFGQTRPRSRSSITPPTQPMVSPSTPITRVPLLNISSISPSEHKYMGLVGSPKTTSMTSPQPSPRSSSLGISQHIQWSIHFYLPNHIIDHIPIDDLNKENVASIIHMIETSNTCIEKDLYKARFAWRKMSNVVVIGGSARDEYRAKWLIRVLQLEGRTYNLYTLPHGLNFTHFEAKYPFSITSFDFVEFQLPTHIFKNIYLSSYRILTQERGVEVLLAKRLNIKRVLNCAKECKCVIPKKLISDDSPTKPILNTSDTLSKSDSFSKTGMASNSQISKISYLHLSLDDFDPKHCYFTAQQMKESVLFINQSLKNNENILIHCQEGRSRSVTIICLYMMISIGWKVAYSLEFIKSQKPTISVHPTFLLELQAIEDYINDKIEKLKGNYSISSSTDSSLLEMVGMIKVDSIIIDDTDPPERYKFTPLYEYSSTDDLSYQTSPRASPRLSSTNTTTRKLRKNIPNDNHLKLDVSIIFNRAKSVATNLSLPDSPLFFDPSTLYLDDLVLSSFLDEIGECVVKPFIENNNLTISNTPTTTTPTTTTTSNISSSSNSNISSCSNTPTFTNNEQLQ